MWYLPCSRSASSSSAGTIGVHVWLPGAYAEAEDDVSAMLSAVVSKVPIFGLMVGHLCRDTSEAGLSLAHALGWIGMLTALAGAMLAVQQDDVKRMLAYSSMSQLGYIVTAIALMSHLGWVIAFYLTANHLMVKGILFLAAAADHSANRSPHIRRTSAVLRGPCRSPSRPRRSRSWPCPACRRSPGSAANGCC